MLLFLSFSGEKCWMLLSASTAAFSDAAQVQSLPEQTRRVVGKEQVERLCETVFLPADRPGEQREGSSIIVITLTVEPRPVLMFRSGH